MTGLKRIINPFKINYPGCYSIVKYTKLIEELWEGIEKEIGVQDSQLVILDACP